MSKDQQVVKIRDPGLQCLALSLSCHRDQVGWWRSGRSPNGAGFYGTSLLRKSAFEEVENPVLQLKED
ncbi:hypothetical protein TCAL_14602 [Tigriopus californicus]|uniref:Uncharacterized protein n=1 Tax=Tigriopus californicus TaxID=6832 RepID=A0A553PDC2_TIGCA|nr:hypothetical protein TCAL_14602 [Tigriopus californicus]